MKKQLIGISVAVAFIAIPVSMKLMGTKTQKTAELKAIELRKIQPTVLASGNLAFGEEAQLSSELVGKVSEVLVKEGDSVVQGQVLLRLDPTVYRSEVAQHEANRRSAIIAIERAQLDLANQQRSFERNKALALAKFIDTSRLDEAKYKLELSMVELRSSREALQQAEALLAQARDRLARTEVRAPIRGTITSVQIKVGETAVASALSIAGSTLMTIANIDTIMANLNVDEADIAGIGPGQAARLFPSAFPDQAVAGQVESVSLTPKVGTQGRSYIVKVRLADKRLALRTGMTCRAEIALGGGSPRPAVPLQAVLTEQLTGEKEKQAHYLLTVDKGVVHKRKVELGTADDTDQEVLKGVSAGETVVVGPARMLRELTDGDEVLAAEPAKKPAAPLAVAQGHP